MKAIVSALIEVSVYSAVIAGAVLLFRAVFRKGISPRLQYLAWTLLILRLAIPVTFESGFHVESLFHKPTQAATVSIAAPAPISSETAARPADSAPTANPAAPAGAAPTEPQRKTDWYAIGFATWLCGAGACALWLGVVKLRYYRRMKTARIDAPAAVEELYQACRGELRAGRAMPIWVVRKAMSPGIVLFGGPILLLPAGMVSSREALRFALLHELTHQKRGDHIVCAAMNLLRVIYWFHPVVQCVFLQMQSDMETACDFDVIRRLRPGEKKGYLATIIHLFSYEIQPQLSMARSHTRRMAERRVKGAFMRSVTSPGSKMAAAALAALLLFTCFTTACRKAPAGSAASAGAVQGITSEPTAIGTVGASAEDGQALRGSYAVPYAGIGYSYDASIENTRSAIERLNANGGAVVQPSEEWSFNDFFGPRTEENGWIVAETARDGSVYTYYAGMEDVSAALYGALLCADLQVTERAANADALRYMGAGLSAAISDGNDLKFVNNTSAPIIMRCALGKDKGVDTLTVEIWGEPIPDSVSYALRCNMIKTEDRGEIVTVDDPTLPRGMRRPKTFGQDGCRVEVYRDAMQAGRTVSSELLYTDTYSVRSDVWLRGTKTPYLLTDMSESELRALAKRLRVYLYDSAQHTFDEGNSHYAMLLDMLEIDFGGSLGDDEGMSFTIGVPMTTFELSKCYPYAAVLYALDPNVVHMDLCSMEYDGTPEDTLSVWRADVEAHYADALKMPLSEYAKSDALMEELLLTIAKYDR